MNLNDDKMTYVNKSVSTLMGMGMNTPFTLIRNFAPETDKERVMNIVIVKALAERAKVQVVIPGIRDYKYLDTLDFWDAIKAYNGEPLLIFKAPKTVPLLTGICQPSLLYNKISINNTDFYKVLWGVKEPMDFPPVFHKPIYELNGMLVRGKENLDGMFIRFTYHSSGEGIQGDRIVLWGQNF